MALRRFVALLSCLFLSVPASAQSRLLSPAEFLGYEMGTQFTPHHRVVDYVQHVAEASPNVEAETYGSTYEGRPLMVAFVSSPDNIARLEEIRTNNLKLAGLAAGEPSGSTPAIVWLSYGVHGNESSSTEAALVSLYHLADPANETTQEWLTNTLVIIDPLLNPDGRERYVQWYRQMQGRTPSFKPDAREHQYTWPTGRTNHYYFDLNRDWAWGVQQESRQRIALYNSWMPHIHADFHEQYVDEPYFFAPAAEPLHEAITTWQRDFQTTIGRNHAGYFNARGWLYFTREDFDLFYPSYGDTWPTFNGAIGMTYEQAGQDPAGLGVVTSAGDTLTLRERIAHHHTTGLSTVEIASRHCDALVNEFRRYFAEAKTSPAGTYRAFVVRGGDNPDRLDALAELLDRQGITYGYSTSSRSLTGYDYATGETGRFSTEPGDLVVSLYQPKSVLARVLFEPEPVLTDSATYDITAWALPYAYGLQAYATEQRLEPDTRLAPAVSTPAHQTARPYAYLAEWKSLEDLRFLAGVLQHGVRVRQATQTFEVEGRRFDAGTLILTRSDNARIGNALASNEGPEASFDAAVRNVASSLNRPLIAVSTGFVTHGRDFGSADVSRVRMPEVAVISGEAVSASALGEVWHFFDEQIGYPATLIDADDLERANLPDYDVLILPDGAYSEVLTDTRLDRLRTWVRAGGRLILMENAVSAVVGKEGFRIREKEEPAADSAEARLQPYAERERTSLSDNVPGSIYRVQLDDTHPLAFGYGDTYFSLKRGSDAYAFMEDAWNVGVLRDGAPVSGYAGYKSRSRLTDTLVFGMQSMGRGSVVYLVDDPLFRGFWEGGKLLFGNAVFSPGA